jgi:hypothetical protein
MRKAIDAGERSRRGRESAIEAALRSFGGRGRRAGGVWGASSSTVRLEDWW